MCLRWLLDHMLRRELVLDTELVNWGCRLALHILQLVSCLLESILGFKVLLLLRLVQIMLAS